MLDREMKAAIKKEEATIPVVKTQNLNTQNLNHPVNVGFRQS